MGCLRFVSYADYDALIHSDRIDAVYIALPNSMHADYVTRALKRVNMQLWKSPSPPLRPNARR